MRAKSASPRAKELPARREDRIERGNRHRAAENDGHDRVGNAGYAVEHAERQAERSQSAERSRGDAPEPGRTGRRKAVALAPHADHPADDGNDDKQSQQKEKEIKFTK